MNAQIAQVAEQIFGCDHNFDIGKDGVERCVYCDEPKPVCQHNNIDCYNDDDEYVGWHCLDCGAQVFPPAAVPIIDDIPF